ncbi:MAG: imidazolonepropionase [Candidatus Hodarchaeales archaeon]|jgi:imidazolonepropionase
MTSLALINIGKLYFGTGAVIDNASLLVEHEKIKEIHKSKTFEHGLENHQVIDVKGNIVTPGLIDGHTHPIFKGSRAFELEYKLQGLSYYEIMQKGGGINYTVNQTRLATRDELTNHLMQFCDKILLNGTTTVEVKTGYHLEPEGELLELEIIKEVNKKHPVTLVPTFLGAHLVPQEFKEKPQEYVDLLLNTLPDVKKQGIAQFTDVFCDKGAFNVEQTLDMVDLSVKLGLPVRLHGEEIIRTGIAQKSAQKYSGKWISSVDHLLKATKEDFQILAENEVTATFMPIGPVVLFDHSFPQYSVLKETNVQIGLGSDFNPNSWFYSMQMVTSLTAYFMKIPPSISLIAATSGNATSLKLLDRGTLEINKKADICIFKAKDFSEIPYHFGENSIWKVIIDGKERISRNNMN